MSNFLIFVMREAKLSKVALKEHQGQALRAEIKGIILGSGINKVTIPYDIDNDKLFDLSKTKDHLDQIYQVIIVLRKIKGVDEVFINDSCPRPGIIHTDFITDEMLGNEKEYYDKQILPYLRQEIAGHTNAQSAAEEPANAQEAAANRSYEVFDADLNKAAKVLASLKYQTIPSGISK